MPIYIPAFVNKRMVKFPSKEIAVWHSIYHGYNATPKTIFFSNFVLIEVVRFANQGLHLELRATRCSLFKNVSETDSCYPFDQKLPR